MKNDHISAIVTIVARVGSFLKTMLIISCVTQSVHSQEISKNSSDNSEEIKHGSDRIPLIRPGSVVMLVGDSLAVGLSARFKSLARSNGYFPVVHAVNGTSIFQWKTWISRDLEVINPDLVLVSLGTNDAVIYDKVRQNLGEYKSFSDSIEASGSKVVWIGPPNISKTRILKIHETRKIIRGSVDRFFESEFHESVIGGDGVHPSAGGYSRWMDSLWLWMISTNIVVDIHV